MASATPPRRPLKPERLRTRRISNDPLIVERTHRSRSRLKGASCAIDPVGRSSSSYSHESNAKCQDQTEHPSKLYELPVPRASTVDHIDSRPSSGSGLSRNREVIVIRESRDISDRSASPSPDRSLVDSASTRPNLGLRERLSPLTRAVDSTVSSEDASDQLNEEESWRAHAEKLTKTGPEDKPSWQDAIKYVVRINRIRRAVGEMAKMKLCPKCASLELKAEKFVVQEREHTLKRSWFEESPSARKVKESAFEVGSGSPRCSLGDLRAIWRRSVICPFCQLVIQSLKEQENTDWISAAAIPPIYTTGERAKDLVAKCFISWEIDGRELTKTAESQNESSKARTRRICLQWQPPRFQKSFLVLVGSGNLPEAFLGRRVSSKGCSPELVRKWIDICHEEHGPRCRIDADAKFEEMTQRGFFGVMDVQDMCLTTLPPNSRYIALSYTWGGVIPFRALLENVRMLQAARGIENVLKQGLLPRMIEDTIKLVHNIGERYLWIDCFCIIQDSNKSFELNTNVMDLVYGNAFFTICAADGNSPNTGLLRFNSMQRHSQHIGDCGPGVRLMLSSPAESYIQKSAWNSRGWTFQERLLSKRCLIFADSRVFFQCRSSTMREDISGEEKSGWTIEHTHAPWQILDDLDTRSILLYVRSVEKYTLRELSRPEDVLSAFKGITNMIGRHLSPMQPAFVFGLPRSHFDWALLWEPQRAAKMRFIEEKSLTTSEAKFKRAFPSWSWSGWTNSVMEYKTSTTLQGTTTHLHEWLMERTWITWYLRNGHGSLKLVWDAESLVRGCRYSYNRWSGYSFNPSDGDEVDAFGRKLRRFQKWPDRRRTSFDKTIRSHPFGVSISQEFFAPNNDFPDQRFLQFWTWSAYFRMEISVSASFEGGSPSHGPETARAGERDDGEERRYEVRDYKNDWCGTVVLDQWQPEGFHVSAEHEFIAVSEAKDFTKEEHDTWTYYMPKEREQSEWDLFYVLLLEVRDEIAYRIGLGKVFKEAFENACHEKQWKEIILG